MTMMFGLDRVEDGHARAVTARIARPHGPIRFFTSRDEGVVRARGRRNLRVEGGATWSRARMAAGRSIATTTWPTGCGDASSPPGSKAGTTPAAWCCAPRVSGSSRRGDSGIANPMRRDSALVQRDVDDGLVSEDAARRVRGVTPWRMNRMLDGALPAPLFREGPSCVHLLPLPSSCRCWSLGAAMPARTAQCCRPAPTTTRMGVPDASVAAGIESCIRAASPRAASTARHHEDACEARLR